VLVGIAAGFAIGLPYLLYLSPIVDRALPSGPCFCAALGPGIFATVSVFDAVGVDFFDASGDLDATGTMLMFGISFVTWFVGVLFVADLVSLIRRRRHIPARPDA